MFSVSVDTFIFVFWILCARVRWKALHVSTRLWTSSNTVSSIATSFITSTRAEFEDSRSRYLSKGDGSTINRGRFSPAKTSIGHLSVPCLYFLVCWAETEWWLFGSGRLWRLSESLVASIPKERWVLFWAHLSWYFPQSRSPTAIWSRKVMVFVCVFDKVRHQNHCTWTPWSIKSHSSQPRHSFPLDAALGAVSLSA